MKDVISGPGMPLCLANPTLAESALSCLPATGVSGMVQSQVLPNKETSQIEVYYGRGKSRKR